MDQNNNPSIVLVEDEPRLRDTLARSLRARHFQVDEATTAAAAVSGVLHGKHDVVLLDVNLPDATGWDVLRQVRAAYRDVPVIVLSAAPPSQARVRELRPFGVLYKPFPMDALLNLIQSALAVKAARHDTSLVVRSTGDGLPG